MQSTDWSVSGLCIITRPDDLEEMATILNARPGVEVHATDPATGRLVAVQECATLEEHQKSLRAIQALPGVLTADLVIHYQDLDDLGQPPSHGGA